MAEYTSKKEESAKGDRERDEKIVTDSLREFAELQAYKALTSQMCEEIASLVLPTSRNTFYYGNYNFPGQKRTEKQIDSTAQMALSRFTAICNSMLTPRNNQWHTLSSSNEYVMKDRASRLWFERVTNILFDYRYHPNANFDSQNQNIFQSLGAFGNGCMFIDKYQGHEGGLGLRYKAVPFGELFFGENHQGQVDRVIRWFRLTPQQAVDQFGDEVPEGIKVAAEKSSQTPYDFIHRICPRDDYEPGRMDKKGKLYASYYISLTGSKLLSEGGYTSFPFAITRYEQTPGEVYGRGPASMVLPAIKTLNAEKSMYLKVGHRAADPVYLLRDDGLMNFNVMPGAQNPGGWSSDGKPLVGTLPVGNMQITKEMMDEERSLIQTANFTDIFRILVDGPTITATEMIERINEKGILLAPTIGRQQSEYCGGLIDRELDVLAEQGVLPPMPPALRAARGEYHVVYTSPLSRAMKAGEVSGVLRTLESVLTIVNATQDPSLLDSFDFDTIIPAMAEIQAVPESWMASPDKIAAKRKNRAQAQQQQQAIAALPSQAAMVKAQAVLHKSGAQNVQQNSPQAA